MEPFFAYTFNQDWNWTLDACEVFVVSSNEGKFISWFNHYLYKQGRTWFKV